jgi:hypothetical protein
MRIRNVYPGHFILRAFVVHLNFTGLDLCRFRQRCLLKELIAPPPRLFNGSRAEGAAHSLFRPGCWMHDVVHKPRAVVVPQVMIWIFRVGSDAEFAHGVWFW